MINTGCQIWLCFIYGNNIQTPDVRFVQWVIKSQFQLQSFKVRLAWQSIQKNNNTIFLDGNSVTNIVILYS